MLHVIVGYGYCGYYLAKELLSQGASVLALSRHYPEQYKLPNLEHQSFDILRNRLKLEAPYILYYLIPPQRDGEGDEQLAYFLTENPLTPEKALYFSSSGVYGDHQGQLVDEESPCHVEYARQKQRLHAEALWKKAYANAIILRVAGIYGPGRLPIEAANKQNPLINPTEAPLTNLIEVRDLAWVASQLTSLQHAAGIFNIADGFPLPSGTLQKSVAEFLNLPPAAYVPLATILAEASPMRKEFLMSSKQLSIEKIQLLLTDFHPKSIAASVADILNDY